MKKIFTVIALAVYLIIIFNFKTAFASTYTGCSQWRIPINPWNGNQILPNSSQRYVNLGGVDMSCADLSGIDFYGVVLVNNRFDNSNLSNTNWGGSSYCGMYFLNVDVTGSNLLSHGTWNCSYGKSLYIPTTTTTTTTTTTRPPTTTTTRPPTTTTTRPPTTTTTTTVPLGGCIKMGNGPEIYNTVRWLSSEMAKPPNNPAYQSVSLALWQSMTHEQKINSGPLYMWPSPTGGCNQLYSYPPVTTTTTTTTTITTIPSTMTTVQPTTTTTVPQTTTTTTTTTAQFSSTSTSSPSSVTVITSTLPPIPSQDFEEIVAVISDPNSTPQEIKTAIIQLDESSITADQANIIEDAVKDNTSIPAGEKDAIVETVKTLVVVDHDSRSEEKDSFIEDVIAYDSKLVLLYSFIAFLLFLLINNSIKYNQIYKYGHRTWLQKLINKK